MTENDRTVVELPTPRDGFWQAGERATFTYSLDNDPWSDIAKRLYRRSGSTVEILTREDDPTSDDDPELATIAQRGDAGMLRTYRVRFEDGHRDTAFEDELSEDRA